MFTFLVSRSRFKPRFLSKQMNTLKNPCGGSGWLGQAITSNNWCLGFEFSHLLFIFNCLTQWRYENEEKEVEKGQRKLIQRWHTLVELTKWKCHNRRLHFTYVRCKNFLTVASKVIWLVGWYSFFFKKWANPGLFFLLFSSFQHDDWIRTADLWYRKRPLCQLSHNHCPVSFITFLGSAPC